MTDLDRYGALQEFNRFEQLINTKEYLTKEEFDFCVAWDDDCKQDLQYVGNSEGDYLNLNVYSEYDHEKRNYESEIGG
jgi:hypothetical protein